MLTAYCSFASSYLLYKGRLVSEQTEYAYPGVFYVLMHVPPHDCYCIISVLSMYTIFKTDTGYQWAPLHVCEVESPSGSFLGSMG
jgi:hypothetical protein